MKTQSTHAATSETTTQPSETDVITADRAAAQGVQGHLSLEAQVTLRASERGYILVTSLTVILTAPSWR